jgi:hypothetical protein
MVEVLGDPRTKHQQHLLRVGQRLYKGNWSFVVPLMAALATFVEDTHGFICTPDLHLHEVRLVMTATRANCHGLIDVLPRSSSAQNVVDCLPTWHCFLRIVLRYLSRIWTGRADKPRYRICLSGRGQVYLQECAIQGTKPHDLFPAAAFFVAVRLAWRSLRSPVSSIF